MFDAAAVNGWSVLVGDYYKYRSQLGPSYDLKSAIFSIHDDS